MEHMPHIGFLTTRTGTRRGAALALALLLAGCGGGGGGADPVVQAGADALPAVATPAEDSAAGGTSASATELAAAGTVERMCKWRPGTLPAGTLCPSTLLQSQFLNTLSAADIQSALATKGSYVEGVTPRYAVTSYKLEYMTTDADGRAVRASGLVSVPQKPQAEASPVLSYQHGTIFHDADAPSNNAVGSEVAVVLASLGYIVLAPDYVGFGASKGTPHPYLLSGPTAAATVDFLTAARSWRTQAGVADNGQLFLTGYSEGGYATMATHRALQAAGSPHLQQLRMVVPGAGPYDVQATMDGLLDVVKEENAVLGALINPGFLRYLGGKTQREVRRLLLRALIPDDADVVYDTRFIDRFLADDVAAIAADSSVHDWKPDLPVRLYHGRDDRTVPYASSTSTLAAMQKRGAGESVGLTDCRAIPAGHMQCVKPFVSFMLEQLAPVAQGL